MQRVRITAVSIRAMEVRVEPVPLRRARPLVQRIVGTLVREIGRESVRSLGRMVPWLALAGAGALVQRARRQGLPGRRRPALRPGHPELVGPPRALPG
jgi:hypothetical protein